MANPSAFSFRPLYSIQPPQAATSSPCRDEMTTSISFHCHLPISATSRATVSHSKLTHFTRCKTPSTILSSKTGSRRRSAVVYKLDTDPNRDGEKGTTFRSTSGEEEQEVDNFGVRVALSILHFYKREISPILPRSCRYVPTCSEYSMIAYKRYGFVKGTVLTTWRICRCNPLGSTGFDPPRWFDEKPPELDVEEEED